MTRRWRLFPKYALLIITLVGSMLFASGAIGLYSSWRETKDHLVALQEEKAKNAATRIEQYILAIVHELSWTALPRADADGDALEQRRIEYLKLQRQAPAITEVEWIDPQGREQLRISRLAMDVIRSNIDMSHEAKFRDASSKEPYYGPVYFRKGTEPYMTIAIPAGSDGGVTVAEVNLKFVWDVVSDIRIGKTGLAYVVDSTGTLIAHPDISLVLKKSDLSASLPQVAALRGGAGDGRPVVARDAKGEEVFSAHAMIPADAAPGAASPAKANLHWTVFVESPRAEAFAPLYATLQRTSLILVVALLISIAASFFLARALVRPLRALQEGAAQIGAGDLERHIEVRTGDELEGLAEQFNRMTAELRESYAGLERKVEQRTAELSEALEQQTATAEILRVISSSVADSQPVFEKILESCAHLFSSMEQGILLVGDDQRVYLGAHRGSARERLAPLFPSEQPPGASTTIFGGQLMHFRDVLHDPDVPPGIRAVAERIGVGTFSQLFAPLVWEGRGIGSLYVTRHPPIGFDDKEIGLLRTFAAQAVIAIQNARLFNETKEALEQQTATAEVLQVISSSVSDTQPVFDKILDSCQRLFAATGLGIYVIDDAGMLQMGGFRGDTFGPHGAVAAVAGAFPRPLAGTATERAMRERRVVHFPDVLADPEVPDPLRRVAEATRNMSIAFAPMLWEGRGVGAIQVSRDPPSPFSDKELTLLKTFADQAVIAIQNARLFNETREALEQQTASSEVLSVISNSVSDTRPVFDSILRSCERLFHGSHVVIDRLGDDRAWHLAAYAGPKAEELAKLYPTALGEEPGIEESILRRQVTHYADVARAPHMADNVRRGCALVGCKALLMAPMLTESRRIGTIIVGRGNGEPFTDKEMALLQTFADQAVIAIQNARLFNETKEALERQQASADVLRAISNSVADAQPVFDTIAERSARLTGADDGSVFRFDGKLIHIASSFGPDPQLQRAARQVFPMPPGDGSFAARAIRDGTVLNVANTLNQAQTDRMRPPMARPRAVLSVPMSQEGRIIGAISVTRKETGRFADKEIELLQTFANQAVIAIQNAHLFEEIQAKSRELEMANKHKSEFLANMSHELRTPLNAIIGFSEVLSEQMFGDVNDKQLEYLRDIHSSGHHLLTLINDILDLSKIEAGRMELDLAKTNLPMLLDNCTTLVRERASRNGLVLALEVEDGLGDWVADVRKLKQIVINLLSNAVKFTPPGGRVTLRARQLEHAVEIAVVDTGVGIANDQQALVFEEFRQAGGDYLRKAEGTGLGLSLAKRFVELHGGSIRVESEPGRGATFAFILPERVVEAVS
jgi:signal transduction histidine kinase